MGQAGWRGRSWPPRSGPDDTVTSPGGARAATASIDDSGVHVRVRCGDRSTRSCCAATAPVPPTWRSAGCGREGLAVDDAGVPLDLTIRSFGILRASDVPPIHIEIEPDDGPPVNGSDAVFGAVAAAAWRAAGHPPRWPVGGL